MLAPWKKSNNQPRQHITKQRPHFAENGTYSRSYGFSSSHVWLWEIDRKEGWALKNWCFELWCWKRLLRVPWTTRRSNQSILKEINPEYSLEVFSSVQSLSHVQLFATPWTTAHQSSLSITSSWSSLKLMSIESVMPSNYLILCCSLLLPSIVPSIRVFSNESALPIRWPKDWSFSFRISPSNEYSRLISLRIDWFDLLESSPTPQFKSINSSALSFLHSPTLTSIHDHWKNHSLD